MASASASSTSLPMSVAKMMPVGACAKAAGERATTRLKTMIAILIDSFSGGGHASREKYTRIAAAEKRSSQCHPECSIEFRFRDTMRSRRTPTRCNDDCEGDLWPAPKSGCPADRVVIGVLRLRSASPSEAATTLRMTKRAAGPLFFPGYCVIAGAGLNLIILLVGLDLHLAECTVQGGVGGSVADVVLAAQFTRDLVEGVFQFLHLVTDVDDAATGLGCQLLHLAIAGVSATAEAVEAAVCDQQHIADRVRLLRGLDRIGDLVFAALVLTVSEQDHGLASHFLGQFIVGCQIDGVVEHSAFGIGTARQGSAALPGQAAATGRRSIDACAVEGGAQQAGRVGEILQQVGFDIETDHKRQIFGAQDLIQEIGPDFLLHLQNLSLAAAGIDQNSQGQGKVRFGGEILDCLRAAVLADLEVVLGQIGNQPAFFVFDIEKELHNVDI